MAGWKDFPILHLLFDKHFGEQVELVDSIAERVLRKRNIRNVDRDHQSVVHGQEIWVSHIRPPFCRKRDSLYCHRDRDVLRRRETSGGFDMIVMSTEEKVGAKIEILPPAMARDVRGERYA